MFFSYKVYLEVKRIKLRILSEYLNFILKSIFIFEGIKLKTMNLLIRIIITAILVVVIAHFIPGVVVANFTTSLIVAVVLGLLNAFVKPILVLLTLPVTLLTFGLFLLVINALMILFCTKIVGGFYVESFWIAIFFSIILSISQSILYGMSKDK